MVVYQLTFTLCLGGSLFMRATRGVYQVHMRTVATTAMSIPAAVGCPLMIPVSN